MTVTAQPERKANHSIDGLGFRKMRSLGLVHTDSVHVENSVDDHFGFSGSKAGEIAAVRKVEPLTHKPDRFFPSNQ